MMFRTLLVLSLATLAACDRTAPPVEGDTDTDADTDSDTDADTDADTDTDTDADTDSDTDADCGTPASLDPWTDHPLEAASLTTTAYTSTTGIGAILAEVPNPTDDSAASASPAISIAVTGAIVTYNNDFNSVWLGGGDGHIQVYNIAEMNALAVGDMVDFTATEVTNYYGQAEVTAIDASTISVTATGQDVYYMDASATSLDYATHQGVNVEFYGTVGAALPDECGTNRTCWPVTNGSITNSVNLSSSFADMQEGECFQVLAPVIYNRGALRIDTSHFDGYQFY